MNLAIAATHGGQQAALLLDACWEHPTLHRLLDLPQSQGLSELLKTEASWAAVIKPTRFAALSFVATGASRGDGTQSLEVFDTLPDRLGDGPAQNTTLVIDLPAIETLVPVSAALARR